MMLTHYTNGNIYTVDKNFSKATDMLVDEEGVLVYVGDKEGAEDFIRENMPEAKAGDSEEGAVGAVTSGAGDTEGIACVDLKGDTVTPGFIDSHSHPGGVAACIAGGTVTVDPTSSLEDVQTALRNARAERKDAVSLLIYGFNEYDLKIDKEYPDASMLDAACEDIPVFALANDVHTEWMNTKCIELLGYDKKLPEKVPKGLEFILDENAGNETGFTGYVKEGFSLLFELPFMTDDMLRFGTAAAMALYHYHGYTAVYEGWASERTYRCARELDEAGKLDIYYEAPCKLTEVTEAFKEKFKKSIYRGNNYNMRTLKIVGDGTLEANNMPLLDPKSYELYERFKNGELDKSAYDRKEEALAGYKSEMFFTDEQVREIVGFALKNGCNIVYHSIGNASQRQALQVFDATRDIGPELTRTIVHNQIQCPEYLDKFTELKDILYFNSTSNWWTKDEETVRSLDGFLIEKYMYKMGTVAANGVHCTLSDDCPANMVEYLNPMWQIGFAVYRAESETIGEGDDMLEYYPSKADGLSREDALRAYTIWPAECMNIADRTGSLEVGKNADFTVWDKNLMDCRAEEIFDIEVLRTYFRGKLVYDKYTTDIEKYVREHMISNERDLNRIVGRSQTSSRHGI